MKFNNPFNPRFKAFLDNIIYGNLITKKCKQEFTQQKSPES